VPLNVTLDDNNAAIITLPDGREVVITLAVTQRKGRGARIVIDAPPDVKVRYTK
jgi:hypothetical protein